MQPTKAAKQKPAIANQSFAGSENGKLRMATNTVANKSPRNIVPEDSFVMALFNALSCHSPLHLSANFSDAEALRTRPALGAKGYPEQPTPTCKNAPHANNALSPALIYTSVADSGGFPPYSAES